MAVVFKLPDLGENIESAQVVSIAAAVGDYIEAEQTLLEVETDKAVTDVPAPIAGRLIEIAVSVGDKLSVGDIIAKIDEAAASSPAPAARDSRAALRRTPPEPAATEPATVCVPGGAEPTADTGGERGSPPSRLSCRRPKATGPCQPLPRSGNSRARSVSTSARSPDRVLRDGSRSKM